MLAELRTRSLFMVKVIGAACGAFALASLVANPSFGQAPATRGKMTTAELFVRREGLGVTKLVTIPLADHEFFRKAQATLIKSRAVLGPALRDPKVAKLATIKSNADPLQWLQDNLVVNIPPDSNLIQVALALPDKSEAVTIVNAVVTAYLENVVEQDLKARINRLEQLRKLHNQYQDELRTKRASLRQLDGSVGKEPRVGRDVRRELTLQDLRENRQELRRTRLQKAMLEAHLAKAKADKVLTSEQIDELTKNLDNVKRQVDVYTAEEDRMVAEIEKQSASQIDLKNEQDDIELLTKTAQAIGREVETLDAELQAVPRVTRFHDAE